MSINVLSCLGYFICRNNSILIQQTKKNGFELYLFLTLCFLLTFSASAYFNAAGNTSVVKLPVPSFTRSFLLNLHTVPILIKVGMLCEM